MLGAGGRGGGWGVSRPMFGLGIGISCRSELYQFTGFRSAQGTFGTFWLFCPDLFWWPA